MVLVTARPRAGHRKLIACALSGPDENPAASCAHAMRVHYWIRNLRMHDSPAPKASARSRELYCRQEGGRSKLGGHNLILVVPEFQR